MQSIVETGCKYSICGGCSHYLCLVEAEFWPQIGPTGADILDAEGFSINAMGLPATCMHVGVGNCLVVKKRGGYHTFLAHLVCHVEMCWKRRRLELHTWNWYYSSNACKLVNTRLNLPPRGMCLSTFDEFHRVTASNGHKFIDCRQFLWAVSNIAGGQPCWGRMMIDRH